MKTNAKDNIFSVYMHTNTINGKKYVGITSKEPTRRWKGNGSGYRNNEHFWNAIQKYGWDNFEHDVIYQGLNLDEASCIEKELIAKYNTNNPNFGYNLTSGGEYGQELSDESRRKMSDKAKNRVITEEWRQHLSEARIGRVPWNKGVSLSEEQRAKISESVKGRKHSTSSIEKMQMNCYKNKAVVLDGVIYASMAECVILHPNENLTQLRAWLRGENSMPEEYKNRGLSYYGVNHEYIEDTSVYADKSVICDGIEFTSMIECDRYYGLPRCTTSHLLHGDYKMPQKFKDMGLRYSNKKRYWYKVIEDESE